MTGPTVCFDDFEVDLRSRELRKSGLLVRLQEQPFQILTMLLERPGDVITRDEIRDRLWPDGTFVDFEHSVNAAIKRLRAALGDAAENPRFVETLHRRGYRFVARIAAPDHAGAVPAAVPTRTATNRRPRLVVLPFTNLSGGDAQDYFSDGLTEEMIMQLGRRCANRIGVLARTSSMLYKNVVRGAGDIGEALRADYLVEGSVRRDGDHVRITAQLIETKGETHLWADSFDRDLADCLAVQTEVASEIAHALTLELLPEPAATIGPRNPAAYQAFLRARFQWNKSGDESLVAAVASYDETLALDPNFGKAYSGRARARISLCDYYQVEPRAALEAARRDAQRALEIDEGDAEAHLALGEVQRTLDWNWDGAEAAYRKALTANPNNEAACRYYGVFLAARGRAEAPAMAERACLLDPLCLVVNTAAASVHYLRGEYESAIHYHRHTLGMEPDFVPAHRGLAACLVELGRHEEALQVFTTLPESRLDPVSKAWFGHALAAYGNTAAATAMANALLSASEWRFVPAYHLALLYAGLGDLSAAFTQLNRACEARDPSLDTLAVEPRFRLLRGDPRYAAVLDRLKLAGPALASQGSSTRP
jgi:TolB-like protein/Tfp pilus assembly protein PilF